MTHLLLFYTLSFYTFGFSILGFAIYSYLKTKNPIIKYFIFLWSSMTVTSACFVINYYIYINFENVLRFYNLLKILEVSVCMTGVSLIFFVHKIYNIKKNILHKVLIFIAIFLSFIQFLPNDRNYYAITSYAVMCFIILSNLYSYILAFKKVLSLNNKSDKKLGLSFLFSFLIFFIMLNLFDILPTNLRNATEFMFYPIFYMWVGGFLTLIGVKKLHLDNTEQPKENFVLKYRLTKREAEIASLLCEGLTYKQISEKLYISTGTVSTHVMHIYEKTKTSSKIQLNNKILNC